jgi:flagellar biosynthesis protein FliQ
MTDSVVLGLLQQMLVLSAILAGPILLVALVVGVSISLLQAMTQVQEMSLTFVPKILAIALTLLLMGVWMLQHAVTFTVNLYQSIPQQIR